MGPKAECEDFFADNPIGSAKGHSGVNVLLTPVPQQQVLSTNLGAPTARLDDEPTEATAGMMEEILCDIMSIDLNLRPSEVATVCTQSAATISSMEESTRPLHGDGLKTSVASGRVPVGFRSTIPQLSEDMTSVRDIFSRPVHFPRCALITNVLQLFTSMDFTVNQVEWIQRRGVGPACMFSGTLNGVVVKILLDSGAQANLISKQVVSDNANVIKMARGRALQMRFANNEEATSAGEIINAKLEVQGTTITIPLLHVAPFNMDTADIILGTPFMQLTKGAISTCRPRAQVYFSDRRRLAGGGRWWYGYDCRGREYLNY